jgi:hypothetical protein
MSSQISPPRRREREELVQSLGVLGVFAVKKPWHPSANTSQGDYPKLTLDKTALVWYIGDQVGLHFQALVRNLRLKVKSFSNPA